GEVVDGEAKVPLRLADVGVGEEERLDLQRPPVPGVLKGPDAIEIPPAVAVRGEVERAVRTPLRLEDRLVLAAGDLLALTERAVGVDLGDPELGAAPGLVRGVPGEQGEAPAVLAQPRIRVEVVARDQDVPLAAAGGVEAENGVDRLAIGLVVVLADRDEPAARPV